LACHPSADFKELVYSLSKHMRAANVTLVMTMEGLNC